MAASNMTMKLLIEMKTKRVMFAEAGKECVDFLFHILALPISSIIRLLTTKDMVGSLGNPSIRAKDSTYPILTNERSSSRMIGQAIAKPNQNKDVLLKPNSATCSTSFPLLLLTNSPGLEEQQVYTCPDHYYYVTDDPRTTCPSISGSSKKGKQRKGRLKSKSEASQKSYPSGCTESMNTKATYVSPNMEMVEEVVTYTYEPTYVSPTMEMVDEVVTNSTYLCPTRCGQSMSKRLTYIAPLVDNVVAYSNGGMVKGDVITYMVFDNLVVKPMSTISSITDLLKGLSIKDVSVLEEKVVTLGMDEALELLKSSLQSKNVLTCVFLDKIKD